MIADRIREMYEARKIDYDTAMTALSVLYHEKGSAIERAAVTKIATDIERQEEATATA